MHKNLIALTIAGLMAAPVWAQSNVTIYGIMDIGVVSWGGSDSHKTSNRIDQGGSAPSRLGFRGTEDLGNGLSAFFVLEAGTIPDLGGGARLNRQAHVGLKGNFGSVSVGHHWNPARQATLGVSVFFAGVGAYQNVIVQQTHLANSIVYSTPSMHGFKVDLAYSTNQEEASAGAQEDIIMKGATDTNRKVWSVSPTYRNGPIYAGLTYEQHKEDTAGGDLDRKAWHAFGSYDFGAIKLNGLYGDVSQGDGLGGSDDKVKQWLVAATIPVSEAGTVGVSYARGKHDVGGPDLKVSQWALGYTHVMSKRTSLYARYAKLSTNSAADGRFAANASQTTVGGQGTNGFERGISVGVRHSF